jgi:hypothetical protein
MKRSLALLAGLALGVPLLVAGSPPFGASEPPPPIVKADGLTSPLKLALDVDGSIYVTQNFAGTLTKVGQSTPLYTSAAPAGTADVGGVSALLGTVYFTETIMGPDGPVESYLKKVDRKGNVTQLADIRMWENQHNPDSKNQYGFMNPSAECAAQAGDFAMYNGKLDSHPYATLGTPIGTVIADAGANALLSVDRWGNIRTVAVFAPQPAALTDEVAAELGAPACAGQTYNWEPVPTDVELGPDGWLYVTLLPGGPEGPALGARGSVVKVNLLTGKVVPVASGLLGATDLAVSPKGDVYVAQLFGTDIAVVKKGTSQAVPFRAAESGAAVEWGPNGLFATVHVFDAGQVVYYPY